MTACITAAVAFVAFLSSALALQTHPRATTAAWVAAPPTKYAPSSPKHVLVSSAGRGKYTWVRARCARGRRNKCLMAGERGLGGGFNPLGCGWNVAEGHFMFNSVSCRSNGLQQQESSSSRRGGNSGARRGGNNGASKTKLNAIGVGVEDVGAGPRDEDAALDAGQGEQGGDLQAAVVTRKTRTGWDYWGYRVLLIGVAAIWGTNFPVVKFVESHSAVSDATAAFVRFTIAAAAMLPFADWKEKEVLLAGMETGAWVALGYFTQAIGLQTSDASVCAFLCSLTVVFVPLIDAFAGRGIKRVTVAASLLALLGTGFLELGDANASWNDLWCVAQALGFGVAFTRIEHYMEKFPGKSLQLSIGQLISVAGLTGIWCAYSCGGHFPDFSFMKDRNVAAALGYTGLVTTSLAVWLETVALEQVPAAEMSVIFSTEPLWATFVSQIFLKETMGPNAAIGAGLILCACVVAQSEKIMELVGMGGSKADVPTDRSEGSGGAEEEQEGGVDEIPTLVLDERDPVTHGEEFSFTLSLLDEQGGAMDVCSEGDVRRKQEANFSEIDAPGVRVGWLASTGVTRSEL